MFFFFCVWKEQVPAQAASSQTAEEMALLAYNRALKLSKPGFDFESGGISSFDYGFYSFSFYMYMIWYILAK